MNMTTKDFKIWLATNELTQKKLAKIIGITEATIINYNRNGRYPLIFQHALVGVAQSLNDGSV